MQFPFLVKSKCSTFRKLDKGNLATPKTLSDLMKGKFDPLGCLPKFLQVNGNYSTHFS